MAAELLGEADLFDALDEESRIDHTSAAKVSSYSATLGNRGRQTTGGRLVLR